MRGTDVSQTTRTPLAYIGRADFSGEIGSLKVLLIVVRENRGAFIADRCDGWPSQGPAAPAKRVDAVAEKQLMQPEKGLLQSQMHLTEWLLFIDITKRMLRLMNREIT